jgi:signal transduction histidine kinase
MPALLDWVIRAVSLFNTIALLWLGLTVLLNTERHTWGSLLAAGGLLMGGLFFVAHTLIAAGQLERFSTELALWSRLIWLPCIVLPYLWYLVMLWWTGVLQDHRQRLILARMTALGLLGLAVLALYPLQLAGALPRNASPLLAPDDSFPGAFLVYPAYSLLSITLALWALGHLPASDRFMGDLARLRARPWLIAASLALLAVSLSVGGIALWFLSGLQSGELLSITRDTIARLKPLDALIASLIAAAVVFIGRAVVSYEIFTGKRLPSGALLLQWQRSLILALGYSAVVAASLALPVDPIYPLLLATLIMIVYIALLDWRLDVDRTRRMERLRPIVASQRLYEHLLTPTDNGAVPPAPLPVHVPPASLPVRGSDASAPFRAVCHDLLGTEVAYLLALGPLAPLVGPPLAIPANAAPPVSALTTLLDDLRAPDKLCLPIEPAQYNGARWAIPLWSERGLIGVLLLGNKHNGALYTQEEIEMARATGERLIDTQASAEMARRLMALQRQRFAESQILDNRTRRILHDDVLPRLHTAMLTLSAATAANAASATPTSSLPGTTAEVLTLLADTHRQIANLLRALPTAAAPEVARLGLIGALRHVAEGELRNAFENITWQLEPAAEQAANHLPPLAAEVLFGAAREAMRNAARYGQGDDSTRPLHLTIALAWRDGLRLSIADDGVGLGAVPHGQASPKGSGQGLALHSTLLAVLGGTLTAERLLNAGSAVVLALPENGLLTPHPHPPQAAHPPQTPPHPPQTPVHSPPAEN